MEKEYITIDEQAQLGVCICGNTPDELGFSTCNAIGDPVEPVKGIWDISLHSCDRCGRIINADTLEVVGRRPTEIAK